MRKPAIRTNGTAISVSVTALGASTVERTNEKASQPLMSRHAMVSVTIHLGDRSRSRSSGRFDERELASVLTSPPTTGLASLASVYSAAIAIAPAPMKRTCVRQIAIVYAASVAPSAAGCVEVRIGTAMAHAII